MPWNDYKYSEVRYARKPGVYRCLILSCEIAESKSSGLPMLHMVLRPSGTSSNVNAYIVGNDHFDDNFSRFLDAFPDLKENGFTKDDYYRYRGAQGAVKLVLDDNGFFKCHMFPWVTPTAAKDLPAFKWLARDDDPTDPPVFGSDALEAFQLDYGGDVPF